jgi:hypothetical protein
VEAITLAAEVEAAKAEDARVRQRWAAVVEAIARGTAEANKALAMDATFSRARLVSAALARLREARPVHGWLEQRTSLTVDDKGRVDKSP